MKSVLPWLLDGAYDQLLPPVISQEFFAPRWLCDHLEEVKEMMERYKAAGAGLLCAPTGGADPLTLEAKEIPGQLESLNTTLVAAALKAAGDGVLVAGVLAPTGPEQGEIPFTRRIDSYARQAKCLKEAGANLLVVREMTGLPEARAAVLGARQSELPVLVTMETGPGASLDEDGLLAALVTLQELGIAGFGLEGRLPPQEMQSLFERLETLAKVPLIAKPAALYQDDAGRRTILSPGAFAAMAQRLPELGVTVLGGGYGSTPEHIEALAKLTPPAYKPYDPRESAALVLAGERGVYHLKEDFTSCQPVDCKPDLSEDILEAENSGCDVFAVRVSTPDDGIILGDNGHLFRMPVCVLADDEDALESALLHFTGRVLVDSRSGLPSETLETLAKRYGHTLRTLRVFP